MATVELRKLVKTFGKTEVLHGIDLAVEDGEFVVFVGPSGCGKSTTLRLLAGLDDVTSGHILIGGEVVNNLAPKERNIAMVFQNYAIYPHMSVRKNIGFGLRTAKMPKADKEKRIDEVAEILGMTELLERRPAQLSGGQRQRVAIGRAMVRNPSVFLFDEPLSNLDAQLRTQMRLEIKKLHQDVGTTIIFVTHDQVEAMTLADRIVVLHDGIIEQVGSPKELYNRPDNLFVAQFIGSPKMNILPCTSEGDNIVLAGGGSFADVGKISVAKIGIRPECITPTDPGKGQVEGVVDVVEYLGADTFLIINCGNLGQVTVRGSGEIDLIPGAEVSLDMAIEKLHYFDQAGNAI
jgi:ABC-type sugar transport system ATPase subunit